MALCASAASRTTAACAAAWCPRRLRSPTSCPPRQRRQRWRWSCRRLQRSRLSGRQSNAPPSPRATSFSAGSCVRSTRRLSWRRLQRRRLPCRGSASGGSRPRRRTWPRRSSRWWERSARWSCWASSSRWSAAPTTVPSPTSCESTGSTQTGRTSRRGTLRCGPRRAPAARLPSRSSSTAAPSCGTSTATAAARSGGPAPSAETTCSPCC
mmetsp:Transcript_9059/g.29949  ORF Transcript_9059/g.29949 Transcript_9059/m.29949 type:complete len:210 (+) Transcript_9059:43-672(+)